MKIIKRFLCFLIIAMTSLNAYAQHSSSELHIYHGNIRDLESLQRGAGYFMNMCAGCHDLQYMRYSQMADAIGVEEYQLESLMPLGSSILNPMTNSMEDVDAARWFGVAPPDLSLVSRSLGNDYLYSFLTGFYVDSSRPNGVNNHYLENTSMPNVLWQYYEHGSEGTSIEMVATDLVNFLDIVGEPIQVYRQDLGVKVIGFLLLFLFIAYALKKEIWKEVK
ncbi:MAG: cytochrome c1 [Gammaproteobacteria bacterium]